MFIMSQKDAAENPGTMTSMLSMCNIPALVLFDTGATHSFMSRKFYALTGSKDVRVEESLEISIPSGKII